MMTITQILMYLHFYISENELLILGKSLPSLNYVTEKQCLEYKYVRKQNLMKPLAKHTQSMGPSNPIITVTEHSPVATSVEFFLRQDSPETPKDEKEPGYSSGHKGDWSKCYIYLINVTENLNIFVVCSS